MSDEIQNLKLNCYQVAGELGRAQQLYAWIMEPQAPPEQLVAPVLPIEPAAEAKGEKEAAKWSDSWVSGHRAGFSDHDRDPTKGDRWQDGYACGARDRANNIKLGEPVPNYDGTQPEAPDTITIAASEQHAEESARAQDLAPLFPSEPQQPATPESLEATGVIDSEAGWWGRKLIKERA